MNPLRTELNLQPSPTAIQHSDRIFTAGSCFADSLGKLLLTNKFKVDVNPLGTSYHPLAIHKLLNYALEVIPFTPSGYVRHAGIWSHYDFHSNFSHPDPEALEKMLKDSRGRSGVSLRNSDVLMLTYGTAWVHELAETGDRVANCHKVPAENFRKVLLTEEEIVMSFNTLFSVLHKLNPAIRVVLTLSPVRHLKDTIELNSVSKAVLRAAIHRITSFNPAVQYFPAYELMMDDLRDYRFYETDRIHPTAEAIAYILEKFADRYFDHDLQELLKEWNSVNSALHHKPFHPGSEPHQKFLRETLKRLELLRGRMDVESEIVKLQSAPGPHNIALID